MKKLNNIKYSIIVVASLMIAISGCGGKPTPMAYVGMHMHTSIDTVQIDPAVPDVYAYDSLGRLEKLTVAQMYITNISFRNKSTQQWYTIPGSIMLKRIGNELYPLDNIPAATYDALRFTVGLNNTLNSAPPSSYSSSSGWDTVLANNSLLMWGSGMAGVPGMASGYTFLNVQGYDSTDHVAFSYQLGGLGDTVQVTLAYGAGFTFSPNEPQLVQYVHVIADYGTLLQNINLSVAPNGSFYSTVPGNVTNATNAWRNVINMFRFECPVPNGNC